MSDVPKRPTYGELEADLLRRGWQPERQRGSHLVLRAPDGRRSFPLPVNHRGRNASRHVVASYRRALREDRP